MTHRVVATAGHVDHGKSTLLEALTGMQPDRLDEERRRGLSIELGFVWTRMHDLEVAFVDVPGHERFIATMLAGAGPIPTALLVVAADDGWAAQSAEHRDALHLLGVPAVAIALTKADLVDAARIAQVRSAVEAEVAGTSLAGAPIIEIDSVSRRGLDTLTQAITTRLSRLPPAPDRGRPRLWIDRSFTVAGAGTVVTGTLTDGTFHTGDRVLLTSGDDARIRGLQALGTPVDEVGPGQRVAVNLTGVDHRRVDRGDALLGGDGWRTTTHADVRLETLPDQRVTRSGAWHLHVGSAHVPCALTPMGASIDAGSLGMARLRFDRSLPLVVGDRLILREAGRRAIVAGGRIADPLPPGRVRGLARDRRAALLAEAASRPAEAARLLVEASGGARDAATTLAATGGAPDDPAPMGLARIGPQLVLAGRMDAWTAVVRRIGRATHTREEVASRLTAAGARGGVADALVDHLLATGVLARSGGGITLAEHADAEEIARRERADRLVRALEDNPLAPPDLDELARHHGIDHRQLAALVQQGAIVRAGKVAFSRGAVEHAVTVLRDLGTDGRPFTAAEAKEAWGTTRRYAIPLLEHLDRTGVTLFDGQLRTLRPRSGPGER
jgi:selenocysteine-specific elongation factor